MYTKQLAIICLTGLFAIGPMACGTSREATKAGTAQAQAGQARTNQSTQTPGAGANSVEQKKVVVAPTGPEKASEVVLNDIYFEFDRYIITPESAQALKENAGWFKANSGGRLTIEGNCDERGTVEYNLALGQKRADAARSYLVNLGVDAKKLDTISYGKEKPLDPAHNDQAWSKNRRDHFVPAK